MKFIEKKNLNLVEKDSGILPELEYYINTETL